MCLNNRFFVLIAVAVLCFHSEADAAETVTFAPHTFTIPDGFELKQVAAPPLVQRPIHMCFDDDGVLYVTDSSGNTDKAPVQLKDPQHRVLRLVDRDGDGTFDESSVFADKLPFPEGILVHDGAVYVGAPPHIWKLRDTNGDHVADERTEWFDGGSIEGCGNDMHGPYLGPDGFFYWCKGAFAPQKHELSNGKTLKSSAAHIYRARPDGSQLEMVITGGMNNPVGLAFSETGERFLSGTFFDLSQPGRRDGVLHAVYSEAITPLLQTSSTDAFLSHAIVYALYEIGDVRSLPEAHPLAKQVHLMRQADKRNLSIDSYPEVLPARWKKPNQEKLAQQKRRLDELESFLPTGDAERGKKLFNNRDRSKCITCHLKGETGVRLGPDLTWIGAIRSERDLLEAIVFPSASIARYHEVVSVVTSEGKVVSGLLVRETVDSMFLSSAKGAVQQVAFRDIDEARYSNVSLMPEGMDKLLKPDEIADLVAYLKASKPPAEGFQKRQQNER